MTAMAGHRWAARTAISGTVFIALGAFWLSFTALADLAARSGIDRGQAWAWPLIVDGIIVVATVSVVALGGQKAAWYPWMLLAGGALISVTANAIHAVVAADADVPDVLAASVAAVPPLVLLAITHLTVILTRTKDTTEPPGEDEERAHADPGSTPTGTPTLASAGVARELEPARVGTVAEMDRRARAGQLSEAGWSNKRIARELDVHPSTIGRWFARAHQSNDTASAVSGPEMEGEES
jgi:hypothetical protein